MALEPADTQPAGGHGATFTLLFTSGSTGAPKPTAVSSAGFLSDISSRNYVEPLVTVSYIPLSHSSDRLKLWEFLGNGGRVGFAYYAPRHWIDHERSKKAASLSAAAEPAGGGAGRYHDVVALFEQVRRLQPTAMACPPNIWTGLYHLYLDKAAAEAAATAAAAIACGSSGEGDDGHAASESARREVAAMFGSRVKFLVTGGAPTPAPVLSFAASLFPKAKFADSYGATECGAITSNGVPIREKHVRVKVMPLAEGSCSGGGVGTGDATEAEGAVGELWVSSPNMSAGYYRDQAQTDQCFVRGEEGDVWYRTGDLVRVVAGGREVGDGVSPRPLWLPTLAVLGRCSAAVRVAAGGRPGAAVVSPDALEGALSASPTLARILVHGRPDSTAVVAVVNVVGVGAFDALPPPTPASVLTEVRRVAAEAGFVGHEVPAAVHVDASASWSVQDGTLTASLKHSRGALLRRYAATLQALHEPYLLKTMA